MITGTRSHIFIGSMEILRCVHVWIDSERHRPLTRMGIVLPDASGEIYRSIDIEDSVEIRIGYRNEAPAAYKGSVSFIKQGNTKDQTKIGVAGEEKPLSDTLIMQSWNNETPEAIIRYAVRQAGLTPGRIDSPGVVFPKFIASDIPVWQVAAQCEYTCQQAFGKDMKKWALWMGADGKVNWGDFDENGDVPEIETGSNLIRHTPATGTAKGLNMIETFLLSGLRHSELFHLCDTRRGIDETYRALRVFSGIKKGIARTFIWYGEENG